MDAVFCGEYIISNRLFILILLIFLLAVRFVFFVFKSKAILETGASPPLDKNAQFQLGIVLFVDQLLDFIRRAIGKVSSAGPVSTVEELSAVFIALPGESETVILRSSGNMRVDSPARYNIEVLEAWPSGLRHWSRKPAKGNPSVSSNLTASARQS